MRYRYLGRIAEMTLAVPFAVAVCFSGGARAGIIIAPNPGGAIVITNSTTATIAYVDTPVTNRVDNDSTTLLALLNGGQVVSETFLAPFSDPSVQAAISAADAILAGHGASFGSPSLISNGSVLQSSVTLTPPTISCFTVPISDLTGQQSTTVTTTFGPASIMVAECQSETFFIIPGQTDINVNTDNFYSIPRNIVTTNTFLDSQTYEIAGTTGTAPVPEPYTAALVLFGLGALVWRHWKRRPLS